MIEVVRAPGMKRFAAVRLWLLAPLFVACVGKENGPDFTGGCPADIECSPAPVMVTGGKTFTQLAAGRYHTCGRTAAGEVWCWGLNTGGQLGAATPATALGSGVPLQVGGSISFKSITAGDFHTCGIATTDAAYCWGSNSVLVLGVQSVADTCTGTPCSLTPVRAGGTMTFTAIDAGASHNCALDTIGQAHCWGYNFLGELGSPFFQTATDVTVEVPGNNSFVHLSSGTYFNCALDSMGAAHCWGLGASGQLATIELASCTAGQSSFLCSSTPVAANTSVRFTALAAGNAFACGLSTTGTIACWGVNGEGQLGSGAFEPSVTPVLVQGGGTWASLVAGVAHACALRSTGEAFCWGVNNTAQLGDGTKVFATAEPQPVTGGKTFTQIVAGAQHTCGLASDGSVWCWGSDDAKQLGSG